MKICDLSAETMDLARQDLADGIFRWTLDTEQAVVKAIHARDRAGVPPGSALIVSEVVVLLMGKVAEDIAKGDYIPVLPLDTPLHTGGDE